MASSRVWRRQLSLQSQNAELAAVKKAGDRRRSSSRRHTLDYHLRREMRAPRKKII
jgi:hypothetical protein